MSNYAFLYGKNEESDAEPIYEYKYEIPFFYKIFVSNNPQIVKSQSFNLEEEKFVPAIESDFIKGRNRLFEYIDSLLSTVLMNYEEFKTQLQKEKEKLSELSYEKVYLECAEVFSMYSKTEDFEKEAQKLLKEISEILNETDNYTSLLKEELQKYDKLMTCEPTGLFKKKKLEQKNKDIENQKLKIQDMLLIGWDYPMDLVKKEKAKEQETKQQGDS